MQLVLIGQVYDNKRLGYNVDNNSLRDKTSGQEQTDNDTRHIIKWILSERRNLQTTKVMCYFLLGQILQLSILMLDKIL